MVYALGYWPEESVVILAASHGRLGPCLRLNLPRHSPNIAGWAHALTRAIGRATASPGTEALFVAAFIGESTREGTEPYAPGAESRNPLGNDAFFCDDSVVVSLVTAWRMALKEGHRVLGAWVVDMAGRRWGTLWGLSHEPSGAGEPPREDLSLVRVGSQFPAHRPPGGTWLVEARGDLEGILASPVGVALTVEGLALCERTTAVVHHRRLPGPIDARAGLGKREAPLRRALEDARNRVNRDSRSLWSCLDQEVGRLASRYAGGDPGSFIIESMPLVSAKALLAVSTATATVAGSHAFLVLTAGGRRAAEGLLTAIATNGPDALLEARVGIRIMTGRSRRRPNHARVLAARIMLSILELVGDLETQDRARVADAYLSWFTGLSSQACEYLARVRTASGTIHAMHRRAMMSAAPIPAWLSASPSAGSAE